MNLTSGNDLIVFSSENFAYEGLRTSDVISKFAENKRVYFFEKPIIGMTKEAVYAFSKEEQEVIVIQPYLPRETSVFEQKEMLLNLLKDVICDENISHYAVWTDTPKAMSFIRNLSPEIIIYDCLKDYSSSHSQLENELFQYADVVLTSGMPNQVPQYENMAPQDHL